jgi:hypothetical protein
VYCGTVSAAGVAELLRMTATSVGAYPADDPLSCELVAGHVGTHMAFAAAAHDGDQWWWLRWDDRPGEVGELIQIDPCEAVLPQGRYADDCVLPQGHPGPHSFDEPPAKPVSGRRHTVRLRAGQVLPRRSRRNLG